jgi:hypothetical protein
LAGIARLDDGYLSRDYNGMGILLMVDQEIQEGKVQGIYTLKDVDVFTFQEIEAAKNNLLVNLSKVSIGETIPQLQDLFSAMQTMLEKYFDVETIAKQRTNKLSFYDIKDDITEAQSIEDLRESCEIAYTNYNIIMKPLMSIPTTKKSYKRSPDSKAL